MPFSSRTEEKILKCVLCDLAYIIEVPQRDACNSDTNQGHFVNYGLFWYPYLGKMKLSVVVPVLEALFSSLSYHIMGNQMVS